jgi:hypothetical protein
MPRRVSSRAIADREVAPPAWISRTIGRIATAVVFALAARVAAAAARSASLGT